MGATILAVVVSGGLGMNAWVRMNSPTDASTFDPSAFGSATLGFSSDAISGAIDAYTFQVHADAGLFATGDNWTQDSTYGGVPWPGIDTTAGQFVPVAQGIISLSSKTDTIIVVTEVAGGFDVSGSVSPSYQYSLDGTTGWTPVGSDTLTGLTPSTTYYFRGSYDNGSDPVVYSPVIAIMTDASTGGGAGGFGLAAMVFLNSFLRSLLWPK